MNRVSHLALAMLFATSVLAEPPKMQPAMALTSLMRTDELLANAAKEGIRRAHAEGKISADARKCAEQFDHAPFTAAVARVLVTRLTAAELEKALVFYRSDTGRKYARYVFDHSEGRPDITFTTSEEMRINQFSRTTYGRKLLTSSILEGVEDLRSTTAAAINDSIEKCTEATPQAN